MNDEHTTGVVQRLPGRAGWGFARRADHPGPTGPSHPPSAPALHSMLHRSYDEQKVRCRWLGKQLRGYDKAAPKQLCRSFIETGGLVKTTPDRIIVRFDRRSHNPILRDAALDRDLMPIPWLGGRSLQFLFR